MSDQYRHIAESPMTERHNVAVDPLPTIEMVGALTVRHCLMRPISSSST